MGEMQFQTDDQNEFGRPPQQSAGADLTGKLVTWGLVSNRQQAEYMMIGLAVLIAVIAFFVYRSA